MRRAPGAELLALLLHKVLHLAVLLDHLPQLLPLLLELGLLLVGLVLERRHLLLRGVARLVRLVRDLDDPRHLLLLLRQLLLELLVDLVEDEALAAQVVDVLAQLLVVRERLVVLLERLVEPVLEDGDLLGDRLVVLAARVDPAHLLALLPDLLVHQLHLLVELVDPPLLELDLARVHVARVLQLGDLRLRRHVVVQLRVLPLQRQLLLQLLVVALQLLDRPALLGEDRLRLPAVRLGVPSTIRYFFCTPSSSACWSPIELWPARHSVGARVSAWRRVLQCLRSLLTQMLCMKPTSCVLCAGRDLGTTWPPRK